MNERIDKIIARKLSGEATAGELQELQDWLSADSRNREEYERVAAFWQQSDELFGSVSFDVNTAWEKVAARTVNTLPAAPKRIALLSWSKYLAAAAALLLLGLFLFGPGRGNKMETLTATDTNLDLVLPDQSRIILRKGSSISYPAAFAANERRVKLEGEAFFEVTRDEHKPFIIAAEQVNVKVLGTSFTVKCNAGTAQVTVSSGKVQMISSRDTGSYLVLTSGKQGNFSGEQLSETTVADSNYLFWKTGKLYYERKPLHSIVAELEQYYHRQVRIAPGTSSAIQEQLITISFDNQSIEAVLNELCQVARCTWQQKNQQYVIAENNK